MSIDTQEPGAAPAGAARIAGGLLSEYQRLPTSGARTALPFELDGNLLLAVPQLSEDIPGQDAHMNGGNSDVDAIIYRWENGQFHEHERLFTPALSCGVLDGIMRRQLIAGARSQGLAVEEVAVGLDALASAEAIILSNSLIGVRAVSRLGERVLPDHPMAATLGGWVAAST